MKYCQLRHAFGEVGRRGDSIATVHRFRLVTRELHRDRSRNARAFEIANGRASEVVHESALRDLRPEPDGFKYSVSGQDTVAKRCKAAGQNGQQTVTVVNNTCMTDPYQYNFAAMYAFIWRHERCHLMQFRNVFPTIPDPRTKLETIVKSDTAAFHDAAFFEPGGYQGANVAILGANTIDPPNSSPEYKFWSRNAGNNAWFLRSGTVDGILAAGC
jgi:hypothetical protein